MRNESIAIVAGASQGIGRATAERLANEGAVNTKLTHPMRLKVSVERQSALFKI
jgi:NAD(P)-dependent dehydrogenase (short-subunit alcohol dehydrogenase family)